MDIGCAAAESVEKEQFPDESEDRVLRDLHTLDGEFDQRLGDGEGALQIGVSFLAQQFSGNKCTDLVEMPQRG